MEKTQSLSLDPQELSKVSSSLNNKFEREIVMIEGTPYNLTRLGKGERWRLAIGNAAATNKTFKKKWMARVYIKSKPMELIVNTNIIIFNKLNKDKK